MTSHLNVEVKDPEFEVVVSHAQIGPFPYDHDCMRALVPALRAMNAVVPLREITMTLESDERFAYSIETKDSRFWRQTIILPIAGEPMQFPLGEEM